VKLRSRTNRTSTSLERFPHYSLVVPFREPERKTRTRNAFWPVLAPPIDVVQQLSASLRNRSVEPGHGAISQRRTKVADENSLRRVIHDSDQGISRRSGRSEDSCLGPTGLKVRTELDREVVCHSSDRVQVEAFISILAPADRDTAAARN